MDKRQYDVEPAGQSGGHCDCCGRESRTVWGYLHSDGATTACYFVHWTRGRRDHFPNLDFLVGTWGDDTSNDRVLVSWLYSAEHNEFRLIDGSSRPAAGSSLCSRALGRDEVRSDPELFEVARALLDAVWIEDQRIAEVKATHG